MRWRNWRDGRAAGERTLANARAYSSSSLLFDIHLRDLPGAAVKMGRKQMSRRNGGDTEHNGRDDIDRRAAHRAVSHEVKGLQAER